MPYSERYSPPVFMDTSIDSSSKEDKDNQQGTISTKNDVSNVKADGDTQLYYVYNSDKIIIAWRGTESLFDAGTDIAFNPVKTESCDVNKTQCAALVPAGKVHNGFWSGYLRLGRVFNNELDELLTLIKSRDLFVCGHSLGELWH